MPDRRRLKRVLLLLAAVLAAPAALAVDEQPVVLSTPSGDLVGRLARPAADGPVPVVLIIAGSGPTDGDGNSRVIAGRNDSLKMLAAALADAGFASVRYDKRGVGASAAAAASESELRFEHYVEDAAAWLGKLAADRRFSGVAVVGHSEGSLIGMLAAQRGGARAFVSVAGVADGASTVLRGQLRGQLPPELAARSEVILAALESGEQAAEVPPPLLALYRPSVQPYLISWFRYVPAAELARLQLPCLVLQGDTDIQVPVAQARALQAAAPRCDLAIVAGMNHVLKQVPADPARQRASYGDPALPISADLVRVLTGFLARSMAVPHRP